MFPQAINIQNNYNGERLKNQCFGIFKSLFCKTVKYLLDDASSSFYTLSIRMETSPTAGPKAAAVGRSTAFSFYLDTADHGIVRNSIKAADRSFSVPS
ncbi:MAG: hypothetical protein K6G17_03075 [Oscillospiraceae bacterium]|nr:hypothetical protein [Oscillospiraceae bacterium]